MRKIPLILLYLTYDLPMTLPMTSSLSTLLCLSYLLPSFTQKTQFPALASPRHTLMFHRFCIISLLFSSQRNTTFYSSSAIVAQTIAIMYKSATLCHCTYLWDQGLSSRTRQCLSPSSTFLEDFVQIVRSDDVGFARPL